MPQCQFPVFCYFCVSEKLHRKYSRNWTKQVRKLLFFPDRGRGPNGSRRGARGWPHHRGAWPSPCPRLHMVRPPWSTSDDAPSPIRSLPMENPKTMGKISRRVLQLRRHWYVSNVSIIFCAPCLFLHHLPCVSLHIVVFLCDFRNQPIDKMP
jgi:hypothetical protein